MSGVTTQHPYYGLDLDVAGGKVSCAVRRFENEVSGVSEPQAIAPSAILPVYQGEPLRADFQWPAHPRGSGDEWPTESRVRADALPLRYPAAYAWADLLADRRDRWAACGDGPPVASASAAQALAAMISSAFSRLSPGANANRPLVVIPNDLTSSQQQRLLDEVAGFGMSIQMIWRPVAAVIAMLDRFEQEGPTFQAGSTLGVLHLGLDRWEFTPLELVNVEGSRIVPARRRPDRSMTIASPGLPLLHRISRQLALSRGVTHSEAFCWKLLWATPWPSLLLQLLSNTLTNEGHAAAMLPDAMCLTEGVSRWQEAWNTLTKPVTEAGFGQRLAPWTGDTGRKSWLNAIATACRRSQITSLLVTGPMGRLIGGSGRPLAQELASQLSLDSRRLWIEGADLPGGLHATGAATCARRLAEGQIAYFDTLPRLTTVITRAGELVWEPLLPAEDRFVPGGTVWKREENLQGFAIRPNTAELTVVVDHEEFETVRQLKALIGECSLPKMEPVSLAVSIEPAAGNAKIEVVPKRVDLFGRRRIFVEWSTMGETGLDPQAWVAAQPRTHPFHSPRVASRDCWNRVRPQLERLIDPLRNKQLGLSGMLESVRGELRQRDLNNPRDHATAISSDGVPGLDRPDDKSILNQFAFHLFARLNDRACERSSQMYSSILRTLANTSTHQAEVLEWISSLVNGRSVENPDFDASELFAIGGCLREPQAVARFASQADRYMATRRSPANWMRALAEVLRYRDNATQFIDNRLCENLSRHALFTIQQQIEGRSAQYLFRYSALIIVYLLRRRAWSDDYLDPKSPLATSIKLAFHQSIELIRARKMKVLGGAVDIPATVQQMIDYIDRHGTGRILMAID